MGYSQGWLSIATLMWCENLNNLRKTGTGDAIILLVGICDLKRKRLRKSFDAAI
jgi:hypothetical protein